MTTIALLLAAGTILVFLETVLVGGIWAAGGIALYIWAVWEAYAVYGAAAAVLVGVLAASMCAAAFFVWLYVLPKTSVGKKLYLNTSQKGGKAPAADFKALVGRDGSALTLLVPSGKVEIDGVSYDARCETGHTEKGAKVRVVSADSFELKVIEI